MTDILNDSRLIIRQKYSIPLFLALICAGLAGNYFSYEVFFNIQFIFGSIFAMLALQLFGLRWGIISALVISSYTYFLWNHPYAIVIMTAEVAIVHLLWKRRGIGFVLADAIYWVFIGIPLVVLFYYGAMQLPFYNAAVTMMKQALNGIANAMAARLIFMAVVYGLEKEQFSLRELIFSLLSLFVLVPSLLLLSLQSRSDLDRTEEDVRASLQLAIQRSVPSVESWLLSHLKNVEYLAWMSATQPLPAMQQAIFQMHTTNPDFLRIGLLDSTATIVAYSPLVDGLGEKNIGKNFADRPFIPVLKQTLKPMLSEVVMGRIGTPKPIVTALAPVVKKSAYAGYVTGILDLENVQQMIATNMKSASLPDVQFILLDKNGKVIVGSRKELETLKPYQRPDGELISHEAGVAQWMPKNAQNVSVSDRWKRAMYVTQGRIGGISEWTLILEQPMAPFQKQLYERYAMLLSWVFAIMLAALALAELASRGFLRSLDDIKMISTDIPAKISSGEEILWPQSAILETGVLIGNFKKMTHALTLQFSAIQRLNAELESRADARTRELQESESKYRIIFNNTVYAICIFDIETGQILDLNEAQVTMYGYSREELLSRMTTYDLSAEPELSAASIRNIAETGARFIPLRYHKKKDGTVFPVEIVGGPYTWKGKRVMFGFAHDITERINAETELMNKTQQLEDLTRNLENEVAEEIAIRTRSEQILVQQSKMAAMGEMLGAIAHQWRQPLNALGLIIQNIRDAHDHGELDQSYIDGTIQRAMSQIRHMSHTIDDFRHFFQLDKDIVSFDTMLAVRDVLSLFSAQLNANEIDYQLTCHTSGNTYTRVEDISDCPENTMKGFRNEFEHVILNLINNAREAIIEKRAKHSVIQDERGLISFDFCHIDGKIIIAVGDNGGGLPENILSRIFEPYYTTKDPSKGTGLGLYMSKVIIEDHMLGKLTAKNSNGGAVFTIELPAAEERILK